MAKTELETRTKEFALNLINLVERMPRNRAGDVVGRQLLRSGTLTIEKPTGQNPELRPSIKDSVLDLN